MPTTVIEYRPPYDVDAMLNFLGRRCIAGVEMVDLSTRTYSRTVTLQQQGKRHAGWFSARFLNDGTNGLCAVEITISPSLADARPTVLARVREVLDLDADPQAINAAMGGSFPGCEGMRVPGTADGFELAVRAVLGQQITVAAARTLAARLVTQWGPDVQTPFAGLNRVFPSAQTLAAASAQTLGELGMVRQRQKALLGLADAVATGRLPLHAGADVQTTLQALQTIAGIGPWTANYIAMRALRWPDAFVAGDVALQKALGVRTGSASASARAAEQASAAWRPWRSYAVIRAWSRL